MALENCLRVSTARPQCLLPSLSSTTSREKLVFKKSMLSFPSLHSASGGAYRKSRFICNAREAVDEVRVVTDSSWNNLVITSESPVLVEFWAPWCGPCRMIAPIIDELAKEYAGKIACYKLNTDDCPTIATQYGIRSIPTVLFFKNGEKKESVIGAVPKSTLSSTVEKYVDVPNGVGSALGAMQLILYFIYHDKKGVQEKKAQTEEESMEMGNTKPHQVEQSNANGIQG